MAKSKPVVPAVPDATAPAASPATCSHCKHYESLAGDRSYGRCRRYPPSVPAATLTAHGPLLAQPLVRPSATCGEFSPTVAGA